MMELEYLQVNTTLDKDLCVDLRYADDTTLISAVFEKLGISTINNLNWPARNLNLKSMQTSTV